MTRPLSPANLVELGKPYVELVTLAHLAFDTPIFVHSGIGNITVGADVYLGVGDLGSISEPNETELLSPAAVTLQLSGVQAAHISEALDAGNYKDAITIYEGYRQTDGTLVDDPWLKWSGFFEYATYVQGSSNAVQVFAQHELANLDDSDNSRYTDEDQVQRFAGDRIFEFIHDMATVDLLWGGREIRGGGGGDTREGSNRDDSRRDQPGFSK